MTTSTTSVTVVNTDCNHEETGFTAMDTSKKFRLQGKCVFITIPQCEIEPKDALETIKKSAKTRNCKVVVAQEDHKDGHKHLHIFIESDKSFNIRQPSYFDFIAKKRGNYQKVKCREAVIQYIVKENNWVSHEIEVLEILQAWRRKLDKKRKASEQFGPAKKIYIQLKEGKVYDDLLEDDTLGSYLVLHGSNVKKLASDFSRRRRLQERILKKPIYCHLVINNMEYDLLCELPFKTPQFWIYGVANVGKTSIISKLFECGLEGFHIPTNNDFAKWDDSLYDFAYIDEFKGQLTIQFLNEFLQGSRMDLPGKYVVGGSEKRRNLPCFILSNYTPEQVYHKKNASDLAPLMSRLRVIELKSYNDYEILTQPKGSQVYLNDLYSDEVL